MRHLRVSFCSASYRSNPDDSATKSRPRSSSAANIGNWIAGGPATCSIEKPSGKRKVYSPSAAIV